MFASLLIFAAQIAPVLAPNITVPLGPAPRRVEQAIAPIEKAGPEFAAACKDWDEWDKPAPPVRIFGNTYYVGTCGISAILITDKAGDILIDGGTDKGADLIAANIRSLGFRLRDIKYLLISHEHFDHAGGIAKLQRMTGAQLVSSPAAAAALNSGVASAGDPQAGMNAPFPAAHVDRVIREGEMLRLGDTIVAPIATPGHTPGALTWHWGACDGGVCRQIVYADSLSPISRNDYRFSDHPEYVAAYRAGIAKVAALDCDILITPHPSASEMVARFGGSKPLVNRDACRDYAADIGKRLDERLAKEAKH